jgi:hypothetical protein
MPKPEFIIKESSEIYFRIVGIIFIILSAIIGLLIKCPTTVQYFIIYEFTGVGVALILAKSAEKSTAKFTVNNIAVVLSGGVALPFILFFANPIGRFKADSCTMYTTNITVSVHGKQGNQDIILRGKGAVLMDVMAKESKESSINDNGQAFFQNLLIGDSVHLNIDFSEPYKAIHPDSIYIIKANDNIYLPVRLEGIDKLKGRILYNDTPLPGVIVELEGKTGILKDTTHETGDYSFTIPEPMQLKEYQVSFIKGGFKTTTATAYPQIGKPLDIVMEKK